MRRLSIFGLYPARTKIAYVVARYLRLLASTTLVHTFTRGTCNDRLDTSHHLNFDASWLLSSLAAQSILGIWSFRRTGNYFNCCANLGVYGTHLDSQYDAINVKGVTKNGMPFATGNALKPWTRLLIVLC